MIDSDLRCCNRQCLLTICLITGHTPVSGGGHDQNTSHRCQVLACEAHHGRRVEKATPTVHQVIRHSNTGGRSPGGQNLCRISECESIELRIDPTETRDCSGLTLLLLAAPFVLPPFGCQDSFNASGDVYSIARHMSQALRMVKMLLQVLVICIYWWPSFACCVSILRC